MLKIYNEEKTIELTNADLEHGYLRPDKLLVKHIDEIPEKVIKTVEQVIEELKVQGKEVKLYDDSTYKKTVIFNEKTGGRLVETVEPVIEPAKPAYDEYEDIQVYHAYTDEEYIEYLRSERERICFPVINRGAAWYARLTEAQKEELATWYQSWLDAPQTGIKPETPSWIIVKKL